MRVIFDAQGTVVDRMDYGPFGENLRAAITFPVEQFAQLARDAETGQDYAQARHYAAGLGRFTRVDPVYAGLFDPQRWNRYAYARSSPFTFIDPSGLDEECPTTFCEVVRGFPTDVILMTKGGLFTGNGGDASAASWPNSVGRGGRPTPPPPPPIFTPTPKTEPETRQEDKCKTPKGPDGHDINANIKTTKNTVKQLNTQHPASGWAGLNWWKDQVQIGGPWDYKSYHKDYRVYEAFGNFNYGATGRSMGMPKWLLHAAGGVVSLKADITRLWNGTVSASNWFDDANDVAVIDAGIAYVDNGCPGK